MSRSDNHAYRAAKVYEVEHQLKDEGYYVFRRTSPHGLFHVLGLKDGKLTMIQVERLHKFNENAFNNSMIKVVEFAQEQNYPEGTSIELWIWINHRGWMKYKLRNDGQFLLYEDFGWNHFRSKDQIKEFYRNV
ncbi:hypothetical protein EG878_14655 [Enterococcus faecalis]|nr:hypothetical protein EG878_14655 [Enterococcus faecalis]